MLIVYPKRKNKGLSPIQKFWTELGFWVTIILSFKNWLKYKAHLDSTKGRVKVNGVEFYVRDIKIVDGHIYLDGEYICPTTIECVSCSSKMGNTPSSRSSDPSS